MTNRLAKKGRQQQEAEDDEEEEATLITDERGLTPFLSLSLSLFLSFSYSLFWQRTGLGSAQATNCT